jgi:hemerythrin-like domain-containing protein
MTMDALESLHKEHVLIRSFLQNLAFAIDELNNGREISPQFFEKSVTFARKFADTYHHAKEEHQMFMRLAEAQSGALDAEVEALRMQHERGRGLINTIAACIDGYAKGDTFRKTDLIIAASGYVSLLIHHIHIEEAIFYPMVRETLSDEDLETLAEHFAEVEQKHSDFGKVQGHTLLLEQGKALYQ